MTDFKKMAEELRGMVQEIANSTNLLSWKNASSAFLDCATALEEAAELQDKFNRCPTYCQLPEGAEEGVPCPFGCTEICRAFSTKSENMGLKGERKQLAKERDDALERVKVLEEENSALRKSLLPDMFWYADGNESCHGCPEEIAELAWDNAHPNDRQFGVIEVQQAARLEDRYYLWKKIDQPDCSLKDFEMTKITGDQASGIWAAQIIEDFARAIARQALQEGEQ